MKIDINKQILILIGKIELIFNQNCGKETIYYQEFG